MKDKKQRGEIEAKALLDYANGIIATLREPFLVLDKELQIISANRAFYDTFRVTEKSTLGRPLPDLGNKQWNIPELLQVLKEVIPEKKVVEDCEVEHKFEQIGPRVMRLNARQLRFPRQATAVIAAGLNEEELILLAIEDVTERKRLQEELKEVEESYRWVFETSRDGLLLIHKPEGSILNSNASIQELLGYSPEEFLGKKLWEIGVVKDESDFQKVMSKLEKDGVTRYEDIPIKTKKGLSISVEIYLVNKAKVIQCSICNVTCNIVKRKEVEEALKESEARFKSIFNESTDGMLLAEIGTRRFFMCNPMICQMLGYAKEELMRLRIDDIHPEKDLAFVLEQFERQAKGEFRLAANLPVKKKDGSIFYADVNASLITLADREYLMGSFRDITDRKKIQDELKEKIRDLERFSKFAVDRELRMEELENRVKELEKELDKKH